MTPKTLESRTITLTGYVALLFNSLLLATLLASSHGVLKWVADQSQDDYSQLLAQWKYIGLALSIYGFIFFYYILVLRSSPVSLLYPVYTGLSVIFVLFVGRIFFDEPVGIFQALGVLAIVVGIVLLGLGRTS